MVRPLRRKRFLTIMAVSFHSNGHDRAGRAAPARDRLIYCGN
jgi:hypothetical protein